MDAKASPGVFRNGHTFQRGDLPIYITDGVGSPFDPYSVRYTVFYQPKESRNLAQVGPSDRVPVKADLGEYYATGYAGESGQPGQWYIRWTLQEYFGGPLVTQEFGFSVFDTASFYSSNGTPSTIHGWSCGRVPGCPRGW